MAHIIKVTSYIHINLTTGSSSQVLKGPKILLKEYQRSNLQSKKSSVTSLTHHRNNSKQTCRFWSWHEVSCTIFM